MLGSDFSYTQTRQTAVLESATMILIIDKNFFRSINHSRKEILHVHY